MKEIQRYYNGNIDIADGCNILKVGITEPLSTVYAEPGKPNNVCMPVVTYQRTMLSHNSWAWVIMEETVPEGYKVIE